MNFCNIVYKQGEGGSVITVTHIEQITIIDPDGQPIFPEVKDSVHEISDPKQRIMALKTIICILAVLQKTAAEIFC